MLYRILFSGLIIVCLSNLKVLSQENYNFELLANVPLGIEGNDIWGYVDDLGIEYAVIGGDTATYVFELSDPSAPKLVSHIVGDRSIWRDFKSYGEYIYGVAYRGNDGFLIIDMSGAPESITHTYYTPYVLHIVDGDTLVNAPYTKAHNIFIDSEGFIYLSDCPGFHRGIAIFQIGDDPQKPEFINIFNPNLSHDIYVKDDKAYSADIFADGFSIWDISDKNNPVQIGFRKTSREFTHNTWLSDDGNILFTTDEQGAAWVESYDVSDPGDIKFLDKIRVVDGGTRNVIPHNTHYYDGFLVTSYYVDGVVVFDASRPDNLVEVGRYDTYLGTQSGFHGCWGAYPYFPSGNIIASDIESGLFVLKPQYTRAAFLEGIVTDAISGDPIQNVSVIIQDELAEDLRTTVSGEFKTGKPSGGIYELKVYHPLYESISFEVELINGEVNEQRIQLTPLESLTISGQVTNSMNGEPIPDCQIIYTDKELVLQAKTNASGEYSISGYPGSFQILAGSWGFETVEIMDELVTSSAQKAIELDPGYKDEFALDLGWTVINENVSAGPWIRDIPFPTFNEGRLSNPDADLADDIGASCYMTGNQPGVSSVGQNDLDDGTTILRSPEVLLQDFDNAVLQNHIWFYASERTDRDQLRNDTLFIQVLQGAQSITIDTITENTEGWELREYNLASLVNFNAPFRIQYAVSDLPGPQQGNLVEAAVDGFALNNKFSVQVESRESIVDFRIYPNPFENRFILEFNDPEHYRGIKEFILVNHLGQEILRTAVEDKKEFFLSEVPPGIYFAFFGWDGVTSEARKLIKTQ